MSKTLGCLVYRALCRGSAICQLSPSIPNASRVVMLSRTLSSSTTSANSKTFDSEALSKMVKSDKVVVFMKGVPDAPRCGFSNAVVQVLRMHGVEFQAHDVLSCEDLRKAIKDYTSWPTIPQIFIDGEFIGGCDILLEKHQNGELVQDLRKIGIESKLVEEDKDGTK